MKELKGNLLEFIPCNTINYSGTITWEKWMELVKKMNEKIQQVSGVPLKHIPPQEKM